MKTLVDVSDRQHDTAVVTGGTDGIGKEIARALASAGLKVIVVGRDPGKGKQVEAELSRLSETGHVTFLPADLSLISEARRVGDEICKRSPPLRYLVHSAGVVRGRHILTSEGLESNFAINYLSRFILTRQLLGSLEAAGKLGHAARILIVGGAVPSGKIYWDDLNLTNNFTTIRALTQFQFANDVFALELARRLSPHNGSPSVTIACFNPGVVKTNIRKEFPLWMKWLVSLAFDPFLAQTAPEAAETALRILFSAEFEGETGVLFRQIRKFRRVAPATGTLDPEVGQKLWKLSEELIARVLADSYDSNRAREC